MNNNEKEFAAKNLRRRTKLLQRPPIVLVGELIPISFMYIARFFNLTTTITYNTAHSLAAACTLGAVLFYTVIRLKKVITRRFIILMYWLQMLYWLLMFILLVSMTGEIRTISLVFAYGTVVYLMAEANFIQSLVFSMIIFITYLSTALISVTVFKQPGTIAMELLYSVGFFLMASYVSYVAGQWEKHRNEIRRAKRDAEESKSALEKANKKLTEMDRQKTHFFQNITHEFRTPLTLITGPVENSLDGAYDDNPDEMKRQFSIVLRNARRLMRLINQILDISKLESGSMKTETSKFDAAKLIRYIKASFETLAERKDISFTLTSDENEMLIQSDREKMEKIMTNLLSNAFKFTDPGGSIAINTRSETENLIVSVTDTGRGIPAEDIDVIFDRFRQVDGSSTREQEGTGIGLSLVKELVELLGGTINVSSARGEGTEFIFNIPVSPGQTAAVEKDAAKQPPGDNHASTEIIRHEENNSGTNTVHHAVTNELSLFHEVPEKKQAEKMNSGTETVLIVDDNPDMRYYIRQVLQGAYQVMEATNGEEGLAMARDHAPALIISDLMMPKMDGNQLLTALRKDPVLKHIPFIILTAKVSDEGRIDELEAGADDYLSKPFNPRELTARVANLLRMMEQKRELSTAHERLNRAYRDMKNDLSMARIIQEHILPRNIGLIQGLSFHIAYMPLIEIGGDFYDIDEKDGTVRIFLADATGHGVVASLVTMLIKSEYEKQKFSNKSPCEIFYQLNETFVTTYREMQMFFTGIIIEINIKNGTLIYASAGHASQYLISGTGLTAMPKSGRAIGILGDLHCEDRTLSYTPGDKLLLFTDGIFEEFNRKKEEYGEERLKQCIINHAAKPAEDIVAEIIADMYNFIDDEINDDICIIGIE